MGNFCGISSNKKHVPQDTQLHPQELILSTTDNVVDDTDTTRTNTPFLATPDPLGLGVGSSSPSASSNTNNTMMRVELVDARLMSLLEFCRQLHFRRRDIFKRIIVLPVHRKAFEDIFHRMEMPPDDDNDNDNDNNEEGDRHHKTGLPIKRSRSSEDLKLGRFKVKPIDSPNDKVKGGGSKDSNPGGSKPAGS